MRAMGAIVNRGRFLGGGVVLVAVFSIAVFKGAGAGPSRAPVPRQDECAKLLEKIKEIERELDTIRERKPPFDKMDQAEINTNTTYRENQIKLHKSRRYALGCPGAEPVTFGSGPGIGGSATGGGSVTGNIPGTLERGGLSLKEYADSVPGAIYIAGDPHTCDLPGKGPLLTVGSSSKARFNPGNLVDREFTSEVQINGMKARAGSFGEDMMGSWGAVISWTLNGLTYTVEVSVDYPPMKDDTPIKRQELYEQCLRRALEAAIPFDKAIRKLK